MKKILHYIFILIIITSFLVSCGVAMAADPTGTCTGDGLSQSNITNADCTALGTAASIKVTWTPGAPSQNNPVPLGPATAPTGDSKVYSLLAPIGNLVCITTDSSPSKDGTTTSGQKNCTPGGVSAYFNIFFDIIIGLCAVLAIVKIVIAGIQYMGEDSVFGKGEAKSGITSALLGLFIALGAYALLNTINPAFLNTNVTIDQASVTLTPDPDIPQPAPPTGTNYPNKNFQSGNPWASDASVRTALASSGIAVSTPSCTQVGQTNCTSVSGLPQINFLVQLKNDCGPGCNITITGGTEFWLHSVKTTHGLGSPTVDLREDSGLKTYLQTSATKTHLANWITKAGADCYTTPRGLGLVDEGTHFHAISTTGGCNINNQGS